MKGVPVLRTLEGLPNDTSAATADHPMEAAGQGKGTNVRGLLVAVAVAVAGGAVMLSAQGLELSTTNGSIGPGWWPTVLGGTLVAGAVAIALVSFRQPDPMPEERVSAHGLTRLGAVLVAIVLYGVAWQYLHFLPVTVVFLSALMFITGGRGVKALLVFPALTAVVLYGLFKMLLQVPL